jgi:pyridoxine kinase
MRELKKLPRCVAIHDLSGYGKCALTVAIPVLSACGVEVCPLPTAILSTNTNFPGFTLFDFSPEIPAYIDHWDSISLKFDAIYSGFLGSAEQIALIADLARRFSPKHVIIDPVMADNGVLYKTYTQEMCAGMKNLVKIADYVTPNLTEACVLTDTKYDLEKTSYDDIKALAAKIKSLGAKNVIITGIERGNTLYNCILDDTGYSERAVPLLPYRMHGTGDLFTSVLAGGILTGHNLYESVDSAAEFVPYTMEKSQNYEDSHRRGVCFEPYLHMLAGGICKIDK